jgi:DHA2 family multidrug resistance protein
LDHLAPARFAVEITVERFGRFCHHDEAFVDAEIPERVALHGAVGQALVFAPLSAVATAGIEAENAGSASGLFNMMRNLGGAVGIAMLQTFLTKREQYHSNVLTQSVSMLEQATRTRIEQLAQYFMRHGVADQAEATHRALVAIGKIVQKQAYILAFSDTFYLLGVALIVALMAALLLKKPDHLESGGAH